MKSDGTGNRCQGRTKSDRPCREAEQSSAPRFSLTKLLSRDLQVGDNVRVRTLNTAGVDCRRGVTVRTSVRYCRVGVKGTRIQYPVDLRKATARCRIPRTINVIAGDV